MSQFLTELHERLVDPYAEDGTGLWQLTAEFRYYSALLKREVVVPVGFIHDHASVPRGPLIYAAFGNRYHRPAVIHDYLVRDRKVTRQKADKVFLEAMRLQNDEEIALLKDIGEDDDAIADRKAALEGRALAMFAAVAAYTKTGLWKKDFDKPGYEPVG